ncbi:MAG: hypothetical protein MUO23_15345 [Anaerolineales bacterium]|nr:hypothetical protein [Anaerolineales bacterium]
MSRGQRTTFLAGSIYLIGTLLPWVVLTRPDGTTVTQNALDLPNGIFVLSIGVLMVVTAFAYRGRPGRRYSLSLVILSAASAFLVAMIGIRLNQAAAAAGSAQTAAIGPGILVTFVSTILALVGGASLVPELPAKK